MTNPLEPNDLSHLSDEEFMALCPQGFHGTGDFEPRSSAAKAILDAYFTHADLLNREVSHEEMLAAAIRALADQMKPSKKSFDEAEDVLATACLMGMSYIANEMCLIANELEGTNDR